MLLVCAWRWRTRLQLPNLIRCVGPVTAPKILEHKVFRVQKFSLLPTSYLSRNSTPIVNKKKFLQLVYLFIFSTSERCASHRQRKFFMHVKWWKLETVHISNPCWNIYYSFYLTARPTSCRESDAPDHFLHLTVDVSMCVQWIRCWSESLLPLCCMCCNHFYNLWMRSRCARTHTRSSPAACAAYGSGS